MNCFLTTAARMDRLLQYRNIVNAPGNNQSHLTQMQLTAVTAPEMPVFELDVTLFAKSNYLEIIFTWMSSSTVIAFHTIPPEKSKATI